MKRKFVSLVLAIIFSLGMVGVSLAAKCKGTVESVEKGKIVIILDGKCKLKAGESVNIKIKRKAVEGC
jgi:hypothetical protein